MQSRASMSTGDYLVGTFIALASMAVTAFAFLKLGSQYLAEVTAHQESPKHHAVHTGNLLASCACLWALAVTTVFFASLYFKYMWQNR